MKYLRMLTRYMESGNALLQILLTLLTPRWLLSRSGKLLILVPAALSVARIPLGWAILSLADGPLWQQGLVHLMAIASDAYDGMLARRWNCTSNFGAVLDPLCDKIYLFWCAAAYWNKMDHIAFGAVVGSEVIILLAQAFGFLIGWILKAPFEDEDFKSHAWGKWKVAIQFAAIATAIFGLRWPSIMLSGAALIAGVGSIIEFRIKRAAEESARQN